MCTKGACGAEDAYLSGRGEQVKIDEERYVDLRPFRTSKDGLRMGKGRTKDFDFKQRRYEDPERQRKVRRYEVKHTGRLELKVGHGASSHWYRYRGRLLGRTAHVVLRLDELEEPAHGEAAGAPSAPAMVHITLKASAHMSILEVGKEDPDTQFILQLPGSKRDHKTFRVTDSPDHLAAWKEVIRAQCCFDSKLPRWKDGDAMLDSPDQLLNQFVRVQTAGRCAPHADEGELGQVVEFKRPFLGSSIFVPHDVNFSSSGVKAILLRRDHND
eukprot:COSAG01_NODE_9922_length_2301_cov_2.470481_1_plen_270_part_10